MQRRKDSFGIALCLDEGDGFKILMIKKKYTYEFMDFVYGKYKKKDTMGIMSLLNRMSYVEKSLISKLNFGDMWEYIWGFNPEHGLTPHNANSEKGLNIFFQKKAQFNSNFSHNFGKRIKNLIRNSVNSEAVWEIPKGRRKINETELDAAMREFKEETGINADEYKIFWHVKPISDAFSSAGVVYNTKYFLARSCLKRKPQIFFKNVEQCIEVQSIKWIALEEIKFLYLGEKKHERLSKLVKRIKKKYRRL